MVLKDEHLAFTLHFSPTEPSAYVTLPKPISLSVPGGQAVLILESTSPDVRTRYQEQPLPHPPPHNARSVTHEALLKPWLSLGLGRTHSGWNRASAPVCLPLFLSGLIRSTSTSGPVHQRSHCVTTQQVFGHPENRDKFSAVDTSAL